MGYVVHLSQRSSVVSRIAKEDDTPVPPSSSLFDLLVSKNHDNNWPIDFSLVLIILS